MSEWADLYRKLSPESSAEPGQWKTSRVPYLREIMDSFNKNEITVIMASAQVGKSETMNNVVGYFMSQDPSPSMVLLSTLQLAETWSKDRLSPMLRDTPILRGLVDDRSRTSGNTILRKSFPGGQLSIAGSNSPDSLSSRPVRFVFCDEVDRYPASAGDEGDPISLILKRTTTFWNRRIGLMSTPTIKGASRIEAAYEESDKRRYFVPCPHCGHFQTLKWHQVKWDKGLEKFAWYECENCSRRIESTQKDEILADGVWRAELPFEGTAGFHINELYSPWRSFGQTAIDFIKAKDNPERLKTWTNTCLGESFDTQGGDGLEWQSLMSRCEPYAPLSVPMKALLLTAGVDIQGNRVAVSIWGWGRGEEAWLIYTIELYGDPTEEPVWKELDALLLSKFSHESGIELGITAVAIDSSYKQTEVFNFVRTRSHRNVYAVRGSTKFTHPIISRPSFAEVTYKGKTYKKGVKWWMAGVSLGKGLIYSRLRIKTPGQGYLHFPIGTDEEYFQQLTAEKLVTRYSKGFPVQEWIKTRDRNEALDCVVYAYAAACIIGIQRFDWVSLEKTIILPKPAIIESNTEEDLQPINKSKKRRSRVVENFATDY